MNRIVILILLLTLALVSITKANYTFQPSDPDLDDLDHPYYYIWKVSWSLPGNEIVSGANLFIEGINDWKVEDGDILYMRLLSKNDIDDAVNNLGMFTFAGDIFRGYDGESGGDNLSSYGSLLTSYTDDDPEPNPSEDFSYTFSSSQVSLLNGYITTDGVSGIGFDPDCHYWNNGVTLTIETVIPTPSAIVLGSIGVGLVGWLRRRRALQ